MDIRAAWDRVLGQIEGWALFAVVYLVVCLLTAGIGLVLLPNVFRATRFALDEDRAPRLADVFDLDRFVDKAILMAIVAVSVLVGSIVPVIGVVLATSALVRAPMLVADGVCGGLEAAELSARAALDDPVGHLFTGVVVVVGVALSGLLAFLPLVVVGPVLVVGAWRAYEADRGRLVRLAVTYAIGDHGED